MTQVQGHPPTRTGPSHFFVRLEKFPGEGFKCGSQKVRKQKGPVLCKRDHGFARSVCTSSPSFPSSDQTAFWMFPSYFSTLPDLLNTFPGHASPEQTESCTASVMMVSLDCASSGYGRTRDTHTRTTSFYQLFLNIPRMSSMSHLHYHVPGQDASSYLTSFQEIFCPSLPVKPCICAMPHHTSLAGPHLDNNNV